MFKKILSAILTVAMLAAFSCQALATDQSELDSLLDAETIEKIFNEYPDEIQYIEDKYGIEINHYTAFESDMIKKAAIEACGTPMSECLSQLATDLAVAKDERSIQNELADSNRSGPSRVPSYLGSTVKVNFGPLKGELFEALPPGVTEVTTVDIDVEVSNAEVIKDFQITGRVGVSSSIEVTGPPDGTMLTNGLYASHRFVTGVLFGTIVERIYQDVDPWTGAVMGQYSEYAIIDEQGYAYAHFGVMSSPMYVESYPRRVCVRCENINDFRNKLASEPERFIDTW